MVSSIGGLRRLALNCFWLYVSSGSAFGLFCIPIVYFTSLRESRSLVYVCSVPSGSPTADSGRQKDTISHWTRVLESGWSLLIERTTWRDGLNMPKFPGVSGSLRLTDTVDSHQLPFQKHTSFQTSELRIAARLASALTMRTLSAKSPQPMSWSWPSLPSGSRISFVFPDTETRPFMDLHHSVTIMS